MIFSRCVDAEIGKGVRGVLVRAVGDEIDIYVGDGVGRNDGE